MDTRDMWENQVNLLTRQVQALLLKCENIENRLDYYEKILGTLIVALKQGGVIVESEDGEHSFD